MAVIRIGIDPNILLGPVTLAWHGVTIVLGIVIGALVASRWLRLRGLPTDPMSTFALLACIGGIVGARIFYLLEHDPAALLAPERLFSSHGFTFSTGGVILAALLILAVIWPLRHRLTRPGDLAWLVLGLFAAGRFYAFLLRGDSPQLAPGLNNAQWTSLALLLIIGWSLARKPMPRVVWRVCTPEVTEVATRGGSGGARYGGGCRVRASRSARSRSSLRPIA